MSQPVAGSTSGAKRLSRPSLASTQFGPRSSSVVRKSRIQTVLATAAQAAQQEAEAAAPDQLSTPQGSQASSMSDTGDDRASHNSDGSAADPKTSLGPRQDSDGASVTENPAEASKIGAAKSRKKAPPAPPSKAPAPPAARKDATAVQVTNALTSVPEGGGVSDWKKSSSGSKRSGNSTKLPAVKPANAGRRASMAAGKQSIPRASVVPRRGGGGPANSPENMARSAAQKKRDREILKKRLKRRVFFMLWYGKAFTPAQVWGLRALMILTIVSVMGVMLETMETSSKGNAFQNFAEPVSDENDPATVNYDRSEAVVDALITLEIIVVIASLIEYAMRLWVCTISKRYVQQYDEASFWLRWGCCFRSCLYGEELTLMGAADEATAVKLLADKKRSVQSPLLPGAAGAMSAAKAPGGAAGGSASPSSKLTPQQLAEQQALARKQGQSMDLKARIMRSRIPTKQELRSLRNKSRIMFAVSTSSMIDIATMLPVVIWAVSGGAADVFGVGSLNLFPAAMRIVRLLRLCKFARYMEGIRLLVAVAVEKRTEMATGFLLCIMVAIVMSGGVFLVETSANPEQFIDFFSAVYYSIITLSTVGYGDKFPITQTGRILGGLGALMGIGLFTLPSSIITSGFEEKSEREYTSRRDGLDMIDIVQRRWELRQAISWWRYAARMQVMAEEHMLRKSALEVLREHRSNLALTEGDYDMDENDSGALENLDGDSQESKSAAVRGHRDSMATSMGGGLGDSISVMGGGARGPPSPRAKQRRGSMGFSVRTNALDAQSTMAISGIARTMLSEEEQLEAIMTQLKPQRSQTEERRLAKALQLLDVCNGDVGEALMILSEVMSGAAAAAIQVGDSRANGSSSLKLKK